MKKLLLGSGIFLALAAGPAWPADMPVKAPIPRAPSPVIAIYNWTGCYIGVEGGGAWGRTRHDTAAGSPTNNFNVRGGLVGGTVGCNYEPAGGPWVVGLEGDFSWVGKRGSVHEVNGFNPLAAAGVKEHWLGTGRARAGFLLSPQVLIYGTGGFAVANVEAFVDDTALGSSVFSETKTRWGWTAGGGVEWAFANNWSVKAEYLFVGLQNTSYFTPTPNPIVTSRTGVPLNDNIVRAGVNYKFDWGTPVTARY
jgi:outer membrane immunogenic protein